MRRIALGGFVGLSCAAADEEPVAETTACVAHGTWIATPAGPRRVESLRVHDRVWSMDPLTGHRVATSIIAIRSAERECLVLRAGAATLVCTPDHPIYDPDRKDYRPASDWADAKSASMLIVEGTTAPCREPVRGGHSYAGVRTVYDLSVDDDLHNFIANEILVHNKTPAFASDTDDESTFEPKLDIGDGHTLETGSTQTATAGSTGSEGGTAGGTGTSSGGTADSSGTVGSSGTGGSSGGGSTVGSSDTGGSSDSSDTQPR